MDCSLSGSSVHAIFQARVLEWIAISFSRGSSNPGIEPRSPALQADALPSEPPGKLWEATREVPLQHKEIYKIRSGENFEIFVVKKYGNAKFNL